MKTQTQTANRTQPCKEQWELMSDNVKAEYLAEGFSDPTAETADAAIYPRNARIERAFRAHFGFDCGPVYEVSRSVVKVGAKGCLYQAITTESASNADLLNGISIEGATGVLLVRLNA